MDWRPQQVYGTEQFAVGEEEEEVTASVSGESPVS